MPSWILEHGQDIAAILETLGFVVLGFFYFYGSWGTATKSRQTESDGLADTLIKRLQETVKQQTADIVILQSQSETQQKEIHLLQGQNDAYVRIFSLRDPNVAKVFEEAPEVYQVIRDTNNIVKNQATALKDLTNAIEKFINSLPPLTATMQA